MVKEWRNTLNWPTLCISPLCVSLDPKQSGGKQQFLNILFLVFVHTNKVLLLVTAVAVVTSYRGPTGCAMNERSACS